jgi:hypothetical protein
MSNRIDMGSSLLFGPVESDGRDPGRPAAAGSFRIRDKSCHAGTAIATRVSVVASHSK